MKNWTILAALLLVTGGLAAVASASDEAAEAPAATAAIGQPAPAFTLTDETGTEHSLEQYRGRIVVLEWTNPECPFVVRHYNERTMHDLIGEHVGDDLVWLSIDSSHHRNAEMATADKARFEMTPPVLLDTDGTVGRAYGARTTPHMYIIDAEGVLRYMGGFDDDARGRQDRADRTQYTRDAIVAMRAGNMPDPSSTTPYGCTVKYEGVQ
ncbi:MAG: thioredoxin family protein [Deltaproteobacteria bacterium]|nr:MAG: thioredoxin family protein [Deltaproteobacteria bacterium]